MIKVNKRAKTKVQREEGEGLLVQKVNLKLRSRKMIKNNLNLEKIKIMK